jgi:putative transposase
MKQSMVKSVHSELKALHTKKEKGEKVGALKYRSYCNSVNLKQYGITYSIDFVHNRVKIQGIKKPLYVRGLKQIPSEAEYANAKLVRKADGIYIYVTCYTKRETPVYTGHVEGVDFGIGHNLTMTDGSTIDISIPESKGTKLAAKRVNKGYKHNGGKKTRNHWRRSHKLRAAYKKDKQRRYDAANKAYHQLVYNNDLIAIQDEMIHNWHKGLFGRKIQYSAMGSVKAKLKHNSKVRVVDRSYPSTQICPRCGMLTKHPLIKRDYDCKYCGYHHDSRDQKAANSILEAVLFDHEVSLEQRAQSPVEADSSAFMPKGMDCKNSSVKQEASDFSRL